MSSIESSFAREIDQASVISFDIFDTLVYRPFVRPIDLFLQIEKDLQLQGFGEERIRAEMAMREKIINSGKDIEITYDEIYNEIKHDYKDLAAIESEYELKYCLPNPEIVKIYHYAQKQRKHIVITSDMYLPIEIIQQILLKAQIKNYEHLILSCATKTSKVDASSYCRIKELYPSIRASKILHIGDNYYTDYLNAKKVGIAAIHYQSIHERFLSNTLISQEVFKKISMQNDLSFSRYYGSLAIEYANYPIADKDNVAKIASEIVLPIVMSFNSDLLQYCKENNIKKILFASRDGYIFKENFDQYFKTNDIHTEKLYVSRRVCSLPAMEFDSPQEFSTWAQGMENASSLELWKNLEIENERLQKEFIKLAECGDRSSHHGIVSIYSAFFSEYGYILKRRYKREADNLIAYLESIDYFNDQTIVIELGWSGSLQNAISKLASSYGKTIFPLWFYLATRNDTHIRVKKQMMGYLVDHGIPCELQDNIGSGCDYVELLFSAPFYGIKSLKKTIHGQFEPEYFQMNEEEEKRIGISQKIFDVIKTNIYSKYHKDFINFSKNTLRVLLNDYIKNLDKHSRSAFQDIKVSANFQNTNYKPFFTPKIMKKSEI